MGERPIAREMRPNRHSLDEHSASRLLQGSVHPDDAPPGYALVADLLATAASLPAVDEDAGAATISTMVEAIRASAPIPETGELHLSPLTHTSRRRSVLGKLFAGKALVAMATVALTAGGAAAATGTLPTPVQGAVADAVSHIGIDLPDNHGQSKKADKTSGDSDDDGATTGTTGNARGHGDDDPGGDDSKGEVISGITHDSSLEGEPKGPTVCAVASDDQCRAGEQGQNSGPGSESSGPGSSNSGPGSTSSGRRGGDDPAGDDHGDGSVGAGTTGTTGTTMKTSDSTTSTTVDDDGGSGHSGSGGSGKGSGQGRSGASDDD